jgi:hypothetical protein
MLNFDIVLTRFANAIMMHMLSEPEIRQAIVLWKYACNHVNATSSMTSLYMKLCGDRFPLPQNPDFLTDELLKKAFKTLKKYQIENRLNCKHPIEPDIEYIISRVDRSEYMSTQLLPSGKTINVSLIDKMKKYRACKENTFCRDEIYDLFKHLGASNSHKKADDIFFKSNDDTDATISFAEFAKVIRMEYTKVGAQNFKFSERSAMI